MSTQSTSMSLRCILFLLEVDVRRRSRPAHSATRVAGMLTMQLSCRKGIASDRPTISTRPQELSSKRGPEGCGLDYVVPPLVLRLGRDTYYFDLRSYQNPLTATQLTTLLLSRKCIAVFLFQN